MYVYFGLVRIRFCSIQKNRTEIYFSLKSSLCRRSRAGAAHCSSCQFYLPPLQFLPCRMEMYRACSTTVFWKHIPCLVSQAHSGEEFCLRTNHTLGLTCARFRCCLEQTLNLELMLKWVKTVGAVRMGAMYFACEKDIHLGVQRVENFGLNCVLPRFIC